MRSKLHNSICGIIILVFLILGQTFAQGDFENGLIGVALNDYGRIRVFAPDFDTRQIDRSSLLVAMNNTSVFDYQNDAEVVDTAMTVASPKYSDYEIYAASDNSWSGLPPAILERINVYGWNDAGYCLARIRIRNDEPEAINAIIGLEFISQVDGAYGFETNELVDGTVITHVGTSTHTGYKILSAEMKSLRSFEWYDGYSDSDADYYDWLTYGKIDTSVTDVSGNSLVTVMAQDVTELGSNAETEFWIGIAVGADIASVQSNMDAAVLKYEDMTAPPEFAGEFETGKIAVTLNEYGRIRVFAPDFDTRQIDRSSLLVAMGDTSVFDYKNDAEAVDSAQTILLPDHSDYEIYAASDNAWSGLPPAILERINVYGWNDAGFCVARIRIRNDEPEAINAIIGLEFISQVDGAYGFETNEVVDGTVVTHVGSSTHTGYKILSAEMTSLRSFDWYDGYSDSDADYYSWLTYGQIDNSVTSPDDNGLVTIMAQDGMNLESGAETDFWIGIAVGEDMNTMLANMDLAVTEYEKMTVTKIEKEPEIVASAFSLRQNYPNPFNPQTRINFAIPSSELVSLKIYNMLGQTVATLVNSRLHAGSYQIIFEAAHLPSGLYFYTLQAGEYVETKKMMLLK